MASIEHRGDSWRVVWRYQGRKQGTTWPAEAYALQAKQIAEAHRHKVDADWVYAQILGETTPDADAEPDGPLLSAWGATWLDSKTRITPYIRVRYRASLDRVVAMLDDPPVNRITPSMVGQLINDLRRVDGLKNTTATRYYSLIHQVMQAAVDEGLIEKNPAKLSDFIRDQIADDDTGDAEVQVRLTHAEYQILRNAFEPVDRPFLDFLAGTGARWSEATATAVKHILMPVAGKKAKPRVRIWRAWKNDGSGGIYLGTTKGRSKREIGITHALGTTLGPLVKERPGDALLFTGPKGGPIHYSNFVNRRWNPAVNRAMRCPEHPPPDRAQRRNGPRGYCRDFGGLRDDGKPCGARTAIGWDRCHTHLGPAPNAVSTCDCPGVLRRRPSPHDLRHTHAAWLFSDPKATPLGISRRLGHQQLSTTSEIYGDLMPEAEDALVDAIDEAMGTAQKPAEKRRSGKKAVRKEGEGKAA